MRLAPVVATALVFAMSGSAFAQEYVLYVSKDDRFTILFPTQPKVTADHLQVAVPATICPHGSTRRTQWVPPRGTTRSRSSTTAAFGRWARSARSTVHAGAEPCTGNPAPSGSTGAGYWKADTWAATIYATSLFLMKKPDLKFMGWATMDAVEGTLLNFVNADKSQTAAAIYMHENKLYIIDGTVPAGMPPPDWFNQNLGWLDENGLQVRYQSIYHNGYPKPEATHRPIEAAPQ